MNLDDPRYLSGELTHPSKGTVTVKDSAGNIKQVRMTDPRYISGELVPMNKRYSERNGRQG